MTVDWMETLASLNKEIADVLALLAVLLAFVIGYFAAILPVADELIRRPASDIRGERASVASRLKSYRLLAIGMIVIIALVLALLSSLSVRALANLPEDIVKTWPSGDFPTIRSGLLLVDLLLLVMLVASVSLVWRIGQRIGNLT